MHGSAGEVVRMTGEAATAGPGDAPAWSATAVAEAIRAGRVSAEELVDACLARIESLEGRVGAWAFLDPEHARQQARDADQVRRAGRPLGPLHGVPVGIMDIFDTVDMPTGDGTVLHAGRQPKADATCVALLRQAGAVIMGKTATTELAVAAPGKTHNPHDPGRTPGGSSGGSAAAVAASMVPLAVGRQTGGSVVGAASCCGVVGYKPTHGLISRHGMLTLSRPLDQVGVFARTLADVALIAEQLMVFDDADPDMRPRARPPLVATAAEAPPVPPMFAFVKTAAWKQANADVRGGFTELARHLGASVMAEEKLPDEFKKAVDWHRIVMEADVARHLARDVERGRDRLSPALLSMIERGRKLRAIDYNGVLDRIPVLLDILDGLFDRYDVIVTPAATGEAPAGLESSTGATFSALWTLCGLPTLSLPLLHGSSGLPIGVQLVGPRGSDARLLRTARWLGDAVQAGA